MEKTVKDSQILKRIVCELNKDKAMKPFDLEKKLVGSLKVWLSIMAVCIDFVPFTKGARIKTT